MRAYYNEIDPYAAGWLRNLIAAGLIPDGDVDERSIVDLRPADLAGYTQCHFFAGIGGWPYAFRLAGWPDARPVWSGSCPCQPLSSAGQRKGHADERHLWPAFHDLISECRSPTVFGEQVASKDGREWLAAVRSDLEHVGYACGSADLPAAGVGAPQVRQRLFWVADAGRERRDGEPVQLQPRQPREKSVEAAGSGATRPVADSDGGNTGPERQQRGGQHGFEPQDGRARVMGDAGGAGLQGPWSDLEWLACSDGKHRPTQPGLFPLVAGLPDSLAHMRAIENAALEEVMNYAQAGQTDPDEILRMVRVFIQAQAGREEQSTRMRLEFHATPLLLDFLLCVEAARDGAADGGRFAQAREEARHRILRSVRRYGGNGCPPRRRRPDEQQSRQSTDPLLALSLVLARHAEAYQSAAVNAHAATCRVPILRGSGNAIVPWVAAEFIAAYMEIRE